MIKIDLITGFLGSGKTTFIKQYVNDLLKTDKVAIIENDYGSINVDMLFLKDLVSSQCGLEMVTGGSDPDTHKRRLKTKLIALAMQGYTRVIVEPSGVFDVDDFFDLLYEEPLNEWYEMGTVITIVDANLEVSEPEESYMLASQLSHAGIVIFSKIQNVTNDQLEHTKQLIFESLKTYECRHPINVTLEKDWQELNEDDYQFIKNAGSVSYSYLKNHVNESFSSLFIFDIHFTKYELSLIIKKLMSDESCGKVIRIKGCMYANEGYFVEVNATRNEIMMKNTGQSQEVIIVIGQSLNEEKIKNYFK